jgi:CHAT domain-containing protein
MRTAEEAADAAEGLARAEAIARLADLRRELADLVESASGGRGQPDSALAQARAVVAAGGAVVAPILTRFGAKILIVTADVRAPAVVDLPELTSGRLIDLLIREASDPLTAGWLQSYQINHLPEAEQAARWGDWMAAIAGLGPRLWRLFAGRLDAALKERGLTSGARLVWLPSGALGILPLALAQHPDSKRRLADDYEIAYAPNLEALAVAHGLPDAPATLAAVVNPTGDLPGTEKEAAIVAAHFAADRRTLLAREAATPEAVLAALKGRTHWHFASHGVFGWGDARQSALLMHEQAPLSVGRLLETDGLGRPRLVVLSACETGLYDFRHNPDEFIGLPGTFTALGAAGVLGTLWPVDDTATALLIAKFYDLHMSDGLPPPTALARAQAWLRQATDAELEAYAGAAAARGRLESRHRAEIVRALQGESLRRSRHAPHVEWLQRGAGTAAPATKGSGSPAGREALARPYAHPYFWAGFIHTGQ